MIRFVDLREQDIGYRFAYFDTVTDCFVKYGGVQAWDDFYEFQLDYDGGDLLRFRNVTPDWALKGE